MMICPKCGSNRVLSQVETESTTVGRTKGFGWIKACLGFLLFSIPGLFCGFCGMGKGRTRTTTRSKVLHTCQDCGNQF